MILIFNPLRELKSFCMELFCLNPWKVVSRAQCPLVDKGERLEVGCFPLAEMSCNMSFDHSLEPSYIQVMTSRELKITTQMLIETENY